ncbi:MAG: sulfatase [Proteiniphilum sp.]
MKRVLFSCTLLFLFVNLLTANSKKKPNIILFLSDDHGAEDAGCFGNSDLRTPVIDQLAADGIVFTRAFSPVSVSAPSRSALFTGLYPHANGCHQNHGSIRPGIRTLPDYLKPLGYEVVLAGKTHIKPKEAFDFTYIERHQIPEFLSGIKEKPFCLIISFNSPHQPYFNHKEGYTGITPKPWMPDTKETRQYTAAYYDHVTILDNEVGACLYWIEKQGYSNALQIYTSDHGAAFPFAKWTLYNQGIKVPLIFKWKGKVMPGLINNELVSFVDILPTIVEIAGGKAGAGNILDGKSLVPLLQNEPVKLHDYLYAAYTNQGVVGGNGYPIRAVFNSKYKLVLNVQHENGFHVARMDARDPRAVVDSYRVLQSWLEKGAGTREHARAMYNWHRPLIELYDMENDPYELVNLGDNPGYQNEVRLLLSELIEWMKKQHDPLTERVIERTRDIN